MTIPDFGSDLVSVAGRTAIVYVCLVVGFRLLGKREAGRIRFRVTGPLPPHSFVELEAVV